MAQSHTWGALLVGQVYSVCVVPLFSVCVVPLFRIVCSGFRIYRVMLGTQLVELLKMILYRR